jgi:ATP-dependent exoDNAse (exonuclease V) beta subunit
MPSVTSLLDEFLPEADGLKAWRDRTPDWKEIMRKKALIGTAVHHYASNWFRINKMHLPELPPDFDLSDFNAQMMTEYVAAIHNFLKFTSKYSIAPVESEIQVYHKKYKYAGTVDLIADVDGVSTIIDFKTSSRVRKNYEAQLVAYKRALLSYDGDPFKVRNCRLLIVKLNFENDLLVWSVADEGKAWALFYKAIDAFQRKYRQEKEWVANE